MKQSRRPLAFWLGAAVCCLVLLACTASRGRSPAPEIPRAAPAYIQWLERQSMLGTAQEYTGLVSGTDMLLRAPSVDATLRGDVKGGVYVGQHGASSGDRVDTLLGAADTWFFVHSTTLLTSGTRTVWEELAAAAPLLEQMGVQGVYVAPVQESGAIWGQERKLSEAGTDVTSLGFAPYMGTDAQFNVFAGLAARRQWQLGMDMVPAATGLGPDFFLVAQHVRTYPGTYMMMEVPEPLWAQLPRAEAPWACVRLDAGQTAALVAAGTLPPALARDALAWAKRGGWAATGEIRGVDGRLRRWVYRFDGDVHFPVLSWDDPSGGARRILSASVIRQVGVLQQTLTGANLASLLGMDAVAATDATPTLEPGFSALRDISREIRRYGGWSVQRDILPLSLLAGFQEQGVDFLLDSVTSPAVEYALLTSDAGPLRTALGEASVAGVKMRRTMRMLSPMGGLPLHSLGGADMAAVEAQLAKQHGWVALLEEGRTHLNASGAALAAASAGIAPESVLKAAGQDVRRRHLLLSHFKAGLPGLVFVSGQDVVGALPLPEQAMASRHAGAWALHPAAASQFSTRQGMPRAPVAYAPVAEQLQSSDSYLNSLKSALTVRRQYGLARGDITGVARTAHPAAVGVFVRLPDAAKQLLLLANFSNASVQEHIPLPKGMQGHVRDLLHNSEAGNASGSIQVTLQPWECRWLLIGG